MKRIEPTFGTLPDEDIPELDNFFYYDADKCDINIKGPQDNYKLAGIGSRHWAKSIDILITMIIFIACLFIVNKAQINVRYSDVIVTLMPCLYFLLCDSFKGQSIGKKLLKLKVVSNKTHNDCNVLQSITRNTLLLLLGFLDLISMLMTKKKRRLGDYLANTVVINYS